MWESLWYVPVRIVVEELLLVCWLGRSANSLSTSSKCFLSPFVKIFRDVSHRGSRGGMMGEVRWLQGQAVVPCICDELNHLDKLMIKYFLYHPLWEDSCWVV